MDPEFIAFDEPATAPDAWVRAQIVDLIRELQTWIGMTVCLASMNRILPGRSRMWR
jgi:ABC-type microcin C transport system duplicated ATPase subunit YejF